ncbi:hypothetical protein D3C76_1860140 [compost metagenome]
MGTEAHSLQHADYKQSCDGGGQIKGQECGQQQTASSEEHHPASLRIQQCSDKGPAQQGREGIDSDNKA